MHGMVKKNVLLVIALFSFHYSYSQSCITGTITDKASNAPMQASVKLLGTNKGVSANEQGFFKICPDIEPPYTLTISHVGFQSRDIRVTSQNQILEVQLSALAFALDRVVVTATLNPQSTWEVPAMVSVIDSINVLSTPATNVDNYLRTIPNLFVDRSKGVFSKNASVSMRGLDGSNRVLILYDGTPLNKTSYGFINWSLISPDIVDQIEVVHGPSSALFGNNAMAGVINIRTKEPKDEKFYGSVNTEAGGYGLWGIRSTLGGKTTLFGKDVRVMANGFWREGDGYIAEPMSIRDSTNVPLYLKERGANIRILVPLSDSSSFSIGANVYADKRGAGRAVYLTDGSYDAYTTNRLHLSYKTSINGYKIDAYAYAQREQYDRQNESLNQTGDNYRIFHTDQLSGDMGLWINASKNISTSNRLMAGLDVKHGFMEATDIYRTSTDRVQRDGKVTFGAVFIQDEQSLLNGKIRLLGGLRLDYATFYDGLLKVTDPTKNTGFTSDTTANFGTNSWHSLNPKLGIRYLPNSWLSLYASVSSGFMPAKLDDLCSSRKITKGFKLANPELQPEHLLTYELGGNVKFNSMVRFDAALFFSQGSDFQYFVATGDSIDTGGTEIKPIVKRQNITSVEVYGGEFSLRFTPAQWLLTRASYSFNHSTISSFNVDPAVNVDLTNNGLAEVPQNQTSFEVFYLNNHIVNLGVIWTRIGKQWGDDINSYNIDPWNTFDVRIWREYKGVKASLDVFDVLDNPYIDKKGLMSPGRYFLFSLGYSF